MPRDFSTSLGILAWALFLEDLGVLDHRDTATLRELALQSDVFAAVLGKLIIHRLVFANHEIGLAVADDAHGPTALDAFCPTGLTMLFADGVVIDVAHHIDNFAGYFFRSAGVGTVLVFLGDRQRRDRQRCNECRGYCDSPHRRSIVW
jgi:hypothetical protein